MLIVGNQKKFEICYLLASMLTRETKYSAVDIENLIRINIKKNVLSTPSFSVDHIRIAMVDNKLLIRQNEIYSLSDEYQGFNIIPEFNYQWLERCQRESPNEKIRCPVCTKKAYPYILLEHYEKKHRREYQDDVYTTKFLSNGWHGNAKKYFVL